MPKKILVVDDEKDIVEIYRKALTLAGYEATCAYNGEEGLNILKANPNFDLVVLDLKMPKMTGDELVKAIRRNPALKSTKVLIMSSVLYHYKETDIYDPLTNLYAITRVEQKGLSKIAKRAENYSTQEKDNLEMEEKKKARLEWGPVYGYKPEQEKEFERNVSENLIKRVKGIFGEPYNEPIFKGRHFQTAIAGKTVDIIAKTLKIDREKLRYTNISFKEGLGIAFIDAIPLRERLEKEFRIKISWESQQEIETVHDLIFMIEHLKMYSRTMPERMKEVNRKIWIEFKPIAYFLIIFLLVGLGMLIWELVIKKYFLKSP